MIFLILGGGGFIGSHIVDKLLQKGHSVRIFERPRVAPYRKFFDNENVEWLTGDLLSLHDVTEAMRGVDAIFHLVSFTLPKNSNDDPIYDVQTNIVASLQILNVMVSLKIPKIIFISSGGTVYGTPVSLPIDESHPTNPHVSYGITKLAIEKYLLLFERLHGIKSVILRVSNPFGERQRIETAQGAVGVFISRALRGLPVEIWGDGNITRDYIHVDDVADAFMKALDYAGKASIFNISSCFGVSLNQLLLMIENVLGLSIERIYQQARPYDIPINILCNKLAGQELGWAPNNSLEEGLLHTSNWVRTQILK
jgi:UDP-glucose 4-epimerase